MHAMLSRMFLLEEVVAWLKDRTEPGPQGRAFVPFEVLRKLPANLNCHCPACTASDEDEDDDVAWA